MKKEIQEIQEMINEKSMSSLKRVIENYSASHLAKGYYHKDTLRDSVSNVPYIQSVFGSALTVLTTLGKNPGEVVLKKANSILAHVQNNGYKVYKKLDVMVVFAYFKLHKILKLELK